MVHSYEIGMETTPLSSEYWAYKTMLGLMTISNNHKQYLIDTVEVEDAQS